MKTAIKTPVSIVVHAGLPSEGMGPLLTYSELKGCVLEGFEGVTMSIKVQKRWKSNYTRISSWTLARCGG
jgi:hypothetical protein